MLCRASLGITKPDSKIVKRLYLTFILLGLLSFAYAQTPQLINYQGVARDASGNVLANQAIGLRINIHSTNGTGPVVYQETHSVTTNQFGLFSIHIGGGTPVTGTLSAIDWGSNTYFTETEMDANGGTNYISMGTSQLVTVPYAFHAKYAENPGPEGPTGPTGANGTTVLTGTGATSSIMVVTGGDIQYKNTATPGVILIDPNNQCWKLTVDIQGNLNTQSVTCP